MGNHGEKLTVLTKPDKSTEHVHLALSPWDISDEYNQHAGVTMNSFLKNCSKPVVVHLLYDEGLSEKNKELSEQNKSRYQHIADKYGAIIQYHHTILPEWVMSIEKVRDFWTPGSLMRLCLQELLPEIDRVIYLDCDTIVNTDVDELWSHDLKGMPLGAVKEIGWEKKQTKTCRKYYDSIGLSSGLYFNSGVILFDLASMRKSKLNLYQTTFSFLESHPDALYPDMDALNYVFHNNWYQLDEKYNNYLSDESAINRYSDCILHTLFLKPWKIYVNELTDLYWDNLLETPWGVDKKNLILQSRNAPSLERAMKVTEEYIYQNGVKSSFNRIVLLNKNILKHGFIFLKKRLKNI